jgi:S-adenosylmethionine decarboxylase
MSRLDPVVCSSFYHPSSSPDASSADYTSPLFASDPADADAHALGSALSDRLGLSALLPSATIDSFLFSPCGFSSNAVQGDRYATIHVTPEVEYSYASFETNLSFGEEVDVIGTSNGHNNGEKKSGRSRRGSTVDSARAEGEPKSVQELVEKVLAVFQPAKFSITLFISMDDSHSTPTAIGDKNLAVLTSKLVEEKFKLVDRIVYEFEGYSLLYIVFEAKSLSKVAMAEEI